MDDDYDDEVDDDETIITIANTREMVHDDNITDNDR